MYVCMYVCMYVFTLAITFITILIHSTYITLHTHTLFIAIYAHTFMYVSTFGSSNLTFTFPCTFVAINDRMTIISRALANIYAQLNTEERRL
jgi:hypothetical protein